jgi:periplasmic divalent cation tolerance protein
MTTPIAVITTVASREDARRIAEALVARRLGACAQISEIDSFFVWDGALRDTKEFRLLLKTTADRYDAVEQAILALHPYDLPAVHAIAFDRVHAPYGAWIADSSSEGPAS